MRALWVVVLALAIACQAPRDASARVVARIPVAAAPAAGLAAENTAVWVPSDANGTLSRIDPLTNQLTATIKFGATPSCSLCWGNVALFGGAVWTTSSSARMSILGIDPASNQVASSLAVALFPSSMTTTSDGTLWVASVLDSSVDRFDASSQRLLAHLEVPRASRLTTGANAVWVLSHRDDKVQGELDRIDPATNQVVANIGLGPQPVAVAADDQAVWVIDQGSQTLERIDPHSNSVVATLEVGTLPVGVAVADASVWVVSQSAAGTNGAALSRIDPPSNTVVDSIDLGRGTPVGLAAGADSLWVALRDPDIVVRVVPAPTTPSGSPSAVAWIGIAALLALVATALLCRGAATRPARQNATHLSELRRFAHDRARRQQ